MHLSPLAQGYGLCRADGVILIPEAGGSIPSYNTQVKNASGALYGHFIPVPKTFLTRRGDIILFTENACDIVHLEQMYTKKIRELYEQQIKTVDDLNRSILFYGSKNPGEYSLNFVRGRFHTDRDIAVQPGHLPAHYLNNLTRHVKINSSLRPRAPPTSSVDPAVNNITLPLSDQKQDTEMADSSDDEYRGPVVIKERPPTPDDVNRLPPIKQVSHKHDGRPRPGNVSPRLNKIAFDSSSLSLCGSSALDNPKSDILALPKVSTGPSAKPKNAEDWNKMGNYVNSVNAYRKENIEKPKPKDIAEESKTIYRSAMDMDIHFLKENRRHISTGDPEMAMGNVSLDDVLVGLHGRQGKKPRLPPLEVQWMSEDAQSSPPPPNTREANNLSSRDEDGPPYHSARQGTPSGRDRRETIPQSKGTSRFSASSRVSPYPSVKRRAQTTPSDKNKPSIAPFAERKSSDKVPERRSRDHGRSHDPMMSAGKRQHYDEYQGEWSPDAAEPELVALNGNQHHTKDETGARHRNGNGRSSSKSIPAVFVDEKEQVYVGEIYGNVEPDQGMNENLPFDYMGLVKNLKQPSSDGGTLTLQSKSLGGSSQNLPLPPGLYVMRPGSQHQSDTGPNRATSGDQPLGIGITDDPGQTRCFNEDVSNPRHTTQPASVRKNNAGRIDLVPESAGLYLPHEDDDGNKQKEGYVLRPQNPDTGVNTPDHRLPQRVLHQKNQDERYVFKPESDHSFLHMPDRKQGKKGGPSMKQGDSGYLLKPGLPTTGAPQTRNRNRMRKRRSSRRRKADPAVSPRLNFDIGSTTKEIIGALEASEDTSKFNVNQVETAKAIRDILKSKDTVPMVTLETVLAAPTRSPATNIEQDKAKAVKFINQLIKMNKVKSGSRGKVEPVALPGLDFDIGSTTKEIIGSIEANEDTSKFNEDQVENAKTIRDMIQSREYVPVVTLETVLATPTQPPATDIEQDQAKAVKFINQLVNMKSAKQGKFKPVVLADLDLDIGSTTKEIIGAIEANDDTSKFNEDQVEKAKTIRDMLKSREDVPVVTLETVLAAPTQPPATDIEQDQAKAVNFINKLVNMKSVKQGEVKPVVLADLDLDIGSTTKEIIGAIEANEDTSKFSEDQVESANTIRDMLKSREDVSVVTLETVLATPTQPPATDIEQDQAKAVNFINQLVNMKSAKQGKVEPVVLPDLDLDIGSTTKEIIGAIEANEDTSKFNEDQVESAKTIRDMLKSREDVPVVTLETVLAAPTQPPATDIEQDQAKAVNFINKLVNMKSAKQGKVEHVVLPDLDLDIGATTKEIIGAIEANEDTSKFNEDQVENAKTIRDMLKSREDVPVVTLETVLAAPTQPPATNIEQDQAKAVNFINRLVDMKSPKQEKVDPIVLPGLDLDIGATTKEIIGAIEANEDTSKFNEDQVENAKTIRDMLKSREDVPVVTLETLLAAPTEPPATDIEQDQAKAVNFLNQLLKMKEINDLQLSDSYNPATIYVPGVEMYDEEDSDEMTDDYSDEEAYSDGRTSTDMAQYDNTQSRNHYPQPSNYHSDPDTPFGAEQTSQEFYGGAPDPLLEGLSTPSVGLTTPIETKNSENISSKRNEIIPPNNGNQYDAKTYPKSKDFASPKQVYHNKEDNSSRRNDPSQIGRLYYPDENLPLKQNSSFLKKEGHSPIESVPIFHDNEPAKEANNERSEEVSSGRYKAPSKQESTDNDGSFSKFIAPKLLENSSVAKNTPKDNVFIPYKDEYSPDLLSGYEPKIFVQTFGSENVPGLLAMDQEEYIINPPVSYPATAQEQESVNYKAIELKGGFNPENLRRSKGLMPMRNLPRHLAFRSQVASPKASIPGTPTRAMSAQPNRQSISQPSGQSQSQPINEKFTMKWTELSNALDQLKQSPDLSPAGERQYSSSSADSGIPGEDEEDLTGVLDNPADNLQDITRLRAEMADTFQHSSSHDLDIFSDITDSDATAPLKDADSGLDGAVPGLIDIPEESPDLYYSGSKSETGTLDGSHAGVYLTQLSRDNVWSNEDVPVYVTADGKVFISSVIVNQPVCSSDRIKFSQQDDADDVHNKPEEGSLTFSDGELTGWVKFPGQKAVRIYGKRWDPRQTGRYLIERKKRSAKNVDSKTTDLSKVQPDSKTDSADDEWELLPIDLSIMLGGKVTINEEHVNNPLFNDNHLKLHLSDALIQSEHKYIVASFDETCTRFSGKLLCEEDIGAESDTNALVQEVEIRGRKWNPNAVGHYYCLKKNELGQWEPFSLPLEICPNGTLSLKDRNLGLPDYNGNEVALKDIQYPDLPKSLSLTFFDGKFLGELVSSENKEPEEIRGIRWDKSMAGKYSAQEKIDDTWINRSDILSISPSGVVEFAGKLLRKGFIVDNKIFVVADGGVDRFFDNTGPITDTNLSGESFLMQRDSPSRNTIPEIVKAEIGETSSPGQTSPSDRNIHEAEIVFNPTRFYGHKTSEEDKENFVEIRGYKWDEAIVGEYFTEVLRSDGSWGGGPVITITPDGSVLVDNIPMSDTLLKDSIVSINNIRLPDTDSVQQCLIAVQDNMLTGWIQPSSDSPKIQIRGSLWKEGPGTHGSYICMEKIDDTWTSSSKALIVTPSNKVRIAQLNLEGEMDGFSAKLERASAADISDVSTVAKLRFDGDTFSGKIIAKDVETEISGFKYETVPGVYLLKHRPLNSENHWTALNLQLVVTENSSMSISGNPGLNIRLEDDYLVFESDTALSRMRIKFADKCVLGQADLDSESEEGTQVEVLGKTWSPKIAGTYETELFTDSGWKAAKNLEITPQGEVLYGSESAQDIHLDADTMSFGHVAAILEDATLSFDNNSFTGNVVTTKDGKSRVIRGKRIGVRPVSSQSGTELSLGVEEGDNFDDLNGQIGSTMLNSGDTPEKLSGHKGLTSDYGSASDVITHQMSRTGPLSSLEEDNSTRSRSPRSHFDTGSKDLDPSSVQASVDIGEIALDISADSGQGGGSIGDGAGVSFETWPPQSTGEGNIDLGDQTQVKLDLLPKGLSSLGNTDSKDVAEVTYINKASVSGDDVDGENANFENSIAAKAQHFLPHSLQENLLDSLVDTPQTKALDFMSDLPQSKALDPAYDLPQKTSALSPILSEKTNAPSLVKNKAPVVDTTEASNINKPDLFNDTPKLPKIASDRNISTSPTNSPIGSVSLSDNRNTRTPLPEAPSDILDSTAALTKPVKLPGIDMKTKGGAAEIVEDAGVLDNYINPKESKKVTTKKGKKKKKGKGKDKPEEKEETASGSSEELPVKDHSPVDLEERVRQDIQSAASRRTPSARRTPAPVSKIDRDISQDSPSPVSSGATTPTSTSSSSLPQREFQGALMAAKKIRDTSDNLLDGKIPSDIREHPVAEEVAEKFGMEMKMKPEEDPATNKLSLKERREAARQKKKDDADRKRKEREEEKRRSKDEEERKAAEEEEAVKRRAERETELAADRLRELGRRKEEEQLRRLAKLEEREKKKREEDKMMDAKKRLEEELRRRRKAEADRLDEIERQKQLELDRLREEQEQRVAEAEVIRAEMEEEMAREMAEYERKVREEKERQRIEDALKAEAERRLLDEEERKRIIALARHLWNKGVRVEGSYLQQELEISSIFYSYFNYLHSEEPFNTEVDVPFKEKLKMIANLPLDKI